MLITVRNPRNEDYRFDGNLRGQFLSTFTMIGFAQAWRKISSQKRKSDYFFWLSCDLIDKRLQHAAHGMEPKAQCSGRRVPAFVRTGYSNTMQPENLDTFRCNSI